GGGVLGGGRPRRGLDGGRCLRASEGRAALRQTRREGPNRLQRKLRRAGGPGGPDVGEIPARRAVTEGARMAGAVSSDAPGGSNRSAAPDGNGMTGLQVGALV